MFYWIQCWLFKRKHFKHLKYLALAKVQADNLSKRSNTKVGAIILDTDRVILSSGYNGAPRGCTADIDNRYYLLSKNVLSCHAEANAISHAAKNGVKINNSIIVVTHYPCVDCAKLIIQAGIIGVITNSPTGTYVSKWGESISESRQLFKECKIPVVVIS